MNSFALTLVVCLLGACVIATSASRRNKFWRTLRARGGYPETRYPALKRDERQILSQSRLNKMADGDLDKPQYKHHGPPSDTRMMDIPTWCFEDPSKCTNTNNGK